MRHLKVRETEAMPLVKRTPMALEIDCRDLTNKITTPFGYLAVASRCGAGVLAKLIVLPSIGLPCGLKLGLEIGAFLRAVGGEMACLVAMNRAFAEAILSRNFAERVSRFEAVIDGRAGWVYANRATTRHQPHSPRIPRSPRSLRSDRVASRCKSGHAKRDTLSLDHIIEPPARCFQQIDDRWRAG
jgi:hypothetical protein